MKTLSQLLPQTRPDVSLAGLYLDAGLHNRSSAGQPYVYANFITSLDGRIAVEDADHESRQVPPSIANPRDWRLYQELAGQADILIASGRYFRQSSIGEAQDTLPVGNADAFEDIRNWRTAQGLSAQPDIAIISGSLDIPAASLAPYAGRRLFVITGDAADTARAHALEQAGAGIIHAGDGLRVEGARLVSELADRGYRNIYSIAGPSVFHTLLAAGVVNRLYLTIACQLLGGTAIDTLTAGPLLSPASAMRPVCLHHDPHAPDGGQLYGIFEPA